MEKGAVVALTGACQRRISAWAHSRPMTTTTRRERQLAEIEAEADRGDVVRALDLAREHLVEFPGDADVRELAALLVANDNR